MRDCKISVTPLAFGSYDAVVANKTQPLDATTTIEVTCTQGVGADIWLDGGQVGQNLFRRQMAGPGQSSRLDYQIYKDAARTTVWGTGTFPGGVALGPAPSGAPRTLVVYGRIPPAQAAPAGAYADEVVVTIAF